MRHDLHALYWGQAACAALFLGAALCYFPSAAPSPPSRTAASAGNAGAAGSSHGGGAMGGQDFVRGLRQPRLAAGLQVRAVRLRKVPAVQVDRLGHLPR